MRAQPHHGQGFATPFRGLEESGYSLRRMRKCAARRSRRRCRRGMTHARPLPRAAVRGTVTARGGTMRKLLPAALIAIPALYYFALFAGAATYPGYSHVTNYASELGAAEAPHPRAFQHSHHPRGRCGTCRRPAHAARADPARRLPPLVDPGGGRPRHVGSLDGDGRDVPDARRPPRRLRARPRGTASAAVRAAGLRRLPDSKGMQSSSAACSSLRWRCWRSCSASASSSPAPTSVCTSVSIPARAFPGSRSWGCGVAAPVAGGERPDLGKVMRGPLSAAFAGPRPWATVPSLSRPRRRSPRRRTCWCCACGT